MVCSHQTNLVSRSDSTPPGQISLTICSLKVHALLNILRRKIASARRSAQWDTGHSLSTDYKIVAAYNGDFMCQLG